jgi:hypothetical protein
VPPTFKESSRKKTLRRAAAGTTSDEGSCGADAGFSTVGDSGQGWFDEFMLLHTSDNSADCTGTRVCFVSLGLRPERELKHGRWIFL